MTLEKGCFGHRELGFEIRPFMSIWQVEQWRQNNGGAEPHRRRYQEIRSYPFKAHQPGFEDGGVKPDRDGNTRQGFPNGDRDCLLLRQIENS